MDIQRVRNLTTGSLHTEIADVYEDLDALVGRRGVMTHMIPAAIRAIRPFLRLQLADPRFWNEAYDPAHVGEVALQPMGRADREAFETRFAEYLEKGV